MSSNESLFQTLPENNDIECDFISFVGSIGNISAVKYFKLWLPCS